jgi:hypothetical protein
MAEDLARREEEFKRSKGFEDAKGREERGALDRLKEEGKRMREEREKKDAGVVEREEEAEKVRAKERRAKERREGNDGAIELGPLDMTLKVKWLRTSRPHLVDAGLVKVWLSTLTAPQPCGIDSIAISPKFLRDTGKGKWGSAAIAFVSLKAAVRLMELCEAGKGTKEWDGVEVGWAAGECPAVLRKEEEVPVRASFPASVSPPLHRLIATTDEYPSDGGRFRRRSNPLPPTSKGTSKTNSRDGSRGRRIVAYCIPPALHSFGPSLQFLPAF